MKEVPITRVGHLKTSFTSLKIQKKWLPGTIMGYAGIRKPKDRADLIVYLHDISPDSESTIE